MTTLFNSGVYRWLNTVNGKSYIGSSANLQKRKNEHIRELSKGQHHSPKLQNAWNKYGAEKFEFEMLAFCKEADLLWQEQIAINAFNAVREGYNISLIAGAPMRGRVASEETSQKQSLAHQGKSQTPEQVEKRAAKHRGTHRSIATRARLSSMRKGRPATESQLQNLALGWNRPRVKQQRIRVPVEVMKQNMRAAWTPERRAAQAARVAQRNKDRSGN